MLSASFRQGRISLPDNALRLHKRKRRGRIHLAMLSYWTFFSSWVAYHATPDSCHANTLYFLHVIYLKMLDPQINQTIWQCLFVCFYGHPQKKVTFFSCWLAYHATPDPCQASTLQCTELSNADVP